MIQRVLTPALGQWPWRKGGQHAWEGWNECWDPLALLAAALLHAEVAQPLQMTNPWLQLLLHWSRGGEEEEEEEEKEGMRGVAGESKHQNPSQSKAATESERPLYLRVALASLWSLSPSLLATVTEDYPQGLGVYLAEALMALLPRHPSEALGLMRQLGMRLHQPSSPQDETLHPTMPKNAQSPSSAPAWLERLHSGWENCSWWKDLQHSLTAAHDPPENINANANMNMNMNMNTAIDNAPLLCAVASALLWCAPHPSTPPLTRSLQLLLRYPLATWQRSLILSDLIRRAALHVTFLPLLTDCLEALTRQAQGRLPPGLWSSASHALLSALWIPTSVPALPVFQPPPVWERGGEAEGEKKGKIKGKKKDDSDDDDDDHHDHEPTACSASFRQGSWLRESSSSQPFPLTLALGRMVQCLTASEGQRMQSQDLLAEIITLIGAWSPLLTCHVQDDHLVREPEWLLHCTTPGSKNSDLPIALDTKSLALKNLILSLQRLACESSSAFIGALSVQTLLRMSIFNVTNPIALSIFDFLLFLENNLTLMLSCNVLTEVETAVATLRRMFALQAALNSKAEEKKSLGLDFSEEIKSYVQEMRMLQSYYRAGDSLSVQTPL